MKSAGRPLVASECMCISGRVRCNSLASMLLVVIIVFLWPFFILV